MLSDGNAAVFADGAASHVERLVQLIARHRGAVLAHVRRILGSTEDAEDVVQDTCIRLLRVKDLWRGERQVRALLFKIATNLAIDELRRRRSCHHSMHVSTELLELQGEGLQPDEIVDRQVAGVVISGALRSLPLRHREVFQLHVDADMSYRAIARHLGVSTKTVERDISGVRALCQDRLVRLRRPTGLAA
jgi:RNA polymerase sigma-70 factor (ECF subfamily)